MSIVERACEQAGVELDRDALPAGKRQQKVVAKTIGLLRKLGGERNAEDRERDADFRRLAVENRQLERERNEWRRRAEAYELKERLQEVGARAKDTDYLLTGRRESA